RSFFFFSSRRRHTRFSRDWSSDVCSSDLAAPPAGHETFAGVSIWQQGSSDAAEQSRKHRKLAAKRGSASIYSPPSPIRSSGIPRSEERRVGKGCTWSKTHGY